MLPLYYYSVIFLQCRKPSHHQAIPVRYQFKAFLNDPDAARPENPIHSTNGGKQHGFAGALVGGIHVFGWTTGAFLKTLDDDWLDRGWAQIAFKRPVYNGDVLDVNTNGPDFTVTNKSGEVCLQGKAGIDTAPFLEEITRTRWCKGEPAPSERPRLTLQKAPTGKSLRPMAVALSRIEHEQFIKNTLDETNPLYYGAGARCHPAWLAGRMIDLLHHSYHYGPAIHTQSQIQNLASAHVDQTFTVTGHCSGAFEKNGHHYIVNDGAIWSEDKTELVRLRHTAIFKLRTAE